MERTVSNSGSILIVEGEHIAGHDLKAALQVAGYRVLALASSAEEAIALADQFKPHLVIMDTIIAGGDDGIAVGSQIRKDFHLPVIFLSPCGEPGPSDGGGAAGCVLRAYDAQGLLQTIDLLLTGKQTSALRDVG